MNARVFQMLADLDLPADKLKKVLAVFAELQASHDASRDEIAASREASRLRSRKYRENKERVTSPSRDASRDAVSYAHIDTSLLTSSSATTLEKQERLELVAPAPEPVKPTKRKQAVLQLTELPPDWELPPEGREYARAKKGWPDPKISDEFERFQLYYFAGGKKHKNWLFAWYKWVTSSYQDARPTNSPTPFKSNQARSWRDEQRERTVRAVNEYISRSGIYDVEAERDDVGLKVVS